jgi:hypothetical protein
MPVDDRVATSPHFERNVPETLHVDCVIGRPGINIGRYQSTTIEVTISLFSAANSGVCSGVIVQ